MRSVRPCRPEGSERAGERGAALMISLLVLLILVAIVFQIHISASTDARVTRNVVNSTALEFAVESALLRVMSELAEDAEAGAAAGAGGGGAAGAAGMPGAPGMLPGMGGGAGGVDSSRDEWTRARRTHEINDVELRILVQQEDGKYNLLTMLTPDPAEAEKAKDRVVRILDYCREGTRKDIDGATAGQMADAMLEFMRRRRDSIVPDPALLTDDEEDTDFGMPLSLRDFLALEAFDVNGGDFRDFRDEDGTVVHSIASFLTVHTSVKTYDDFQAEKQQQAGETEGGITGAETSDEEIEGGPSGMPDAGRAEEAQGMSQGSTGDAELPGAAGGGNGAPGVAVNLNLAPRAVLEALFDDREVPREFWWRAVEHRNEELEEEKEDDEEPVLDEFGEELIERQIFESVADLAQIDGWDHLEPLVKADIEQLVTVKGDVFTILLTARYKRGAAPDELLDADPAQIREEEERGDALTLNVRSIVWRTQVDGEWVCVPLERWELLDYTPFEVLDFPGEDR